MEQFIEKFKKENLFDHNEIDIHNDNEKILFTLGRSFDSNVKNKEGKVHLVCSRFTVKDVINYDNLSRHLSMLGYNKHIIYMNLRNIKRNLNKPRPIYDYNNLYIHSVNIYNLFKIYRESSMLSDIIGQNNFEKEFDNILVDSLFIIEDMNWETFKYILEKNDIKISGGDIKKRDKLSTVQYTLSFFLIFLGYNIQNIYQSFNSKSISSKYKDISDQVKIIENTNDILYYILLQNELKSSVSKEIGNLKIRIEEIEKEVKICDEKITEEIDFMSPAYGVDESEIEKELKKLKESLLKRKKEAEIKIASKEEFKKN